jgi:hypothetical protein
MRICTFEDRRHHLVGLQLLAHSLGRVCPGQALDVWCPESLIDPFRAGLPPHVSVHAWRRADVTGWSVKPALLLDRLDEGPEDVVWIDSDVIVAGEFRDRLDAAGAMVVAGEPHWAARLNHVDRAGSWGLTRAREFPNLVNSCIVRVLADQQPILDEWRRRLASPEYLAAQRVPFDERPPHLRGDQDVLDALLTSTLFADVPVRMLEPGHDIVQCHMADGYSVRDRVRHAWRALPPLVHSEGFKPWNQPRDRLFLDVSPYVLVAAQYRDQLEGDTDWLASASVPGRALRYLTGDEPSAAGILPALVSELQRGLRVRTRIAALMTRPPSERMQA